MQAFPLYSADLCDIMRDGDPLGVWFILRSLFCHTERCTVER